MKYLLILGIALVLLWWWRKRPAATLSPTAAAQQAMVQCARCAVHLPQSEALPGRSRWYCCEQHRQSGEV